MRNCRRNCHPVATAIACRREVMPRPLARSYAIRNSQTRIAPPLRAKADHCNVPRPAYPYERPQHRRPQPADFGQTGHRARCVGRRVRAGRRRRAPAWSILGSTVVRSGDRARLRADSFCLVLQQKLGFDLCSPADDLLLRLPPPFLKRELTQRILAGALTSLPAIREAGYAEAISRRSVYLAGRTRRRMSRPPAGHRGLGR